MSKTIVFTGGTNGLGRAAARALAAQGHSLAIIARDKQRGEETLASFSSSSSSPSPNQHHRLFLAELSSISSLKRVAKEIREAYPEGIDVLVNNAGAMFKNRTVVEGVEKTIALNHLSYFVLTLELRELLVMRRGRVVNTASWMHSHKGAVWDAGEFRLAFEQHDCPKVL